MAAPNIVNVANILGRTQGYLVTTSLATALQNPDASGKVFKVNTLLAANVDGVATQDLTIAFYDKSADVSYRILYTLAIPADATLDVLSKTIYLEEGDEIRAQAGANGDLELVLSWEELS